MMEMEAEGEEHYAVEKGEEGSRNSFEAKKETKGKKPLKEKENKAPSQKPIERIWQAS